MPLRWSVGAGVALTGGGIGARQTLGLGGASAGVGPSEFGQIYFRNATLAMAATVAALSASELWWHATVRRVFACLLIGNALIVGAAAAAYGGRILGLHMVLELVGFALAGAPLVRPSGDAAPMPRVVGQGICSLVILAAAAALETHST